MSFNDDFKCPMCYTRHSLRHCRTFLQLDPGEKARFVRRSRYCINCLGMGHRIAFCPCQTGCRTCKLAHHTLMHPLDANLKYWVKMTAEAFLHSPGKIEPAVKVRVLLNPMAQDSCIYFGHPLPAYDPQFGSFLKVVLTSTNNNVRTYTATLRICQSDRIMEHWHYLDVRRISYIYPKQVVADTHFYRPGPISVILGRDATDGIYMGLPILEPSMPYVQNTIFGWTFFGEIPKRC